MLTDRLTDRLRSLTRSRCSDPSRPQAAKSTRDQRLDLQGGRLWRFDHQAYSNRGYDRDWHAALLRTRRYAHTNM